MSAGSARPIISSNIVAFYVAMNDKETEGEEGVQQAEQGEGDGLAEGGEGAMQGGEGDMLADEGEGDKQTAEGEELAEGANETEGVAEQAVGGEGDDEVFINPVAESVIVGPAELVIGIEKPLIGVTVLEL